MNEADTRARLIDPKLKQSGWGKQARRLKHRHEETDAELKRLEQSILDRAFRGELSE